MQSGTMETSSSWFCRKKELVINLSSCLVSVSDRILYKLDVCQVLLTQTLSWFLENALTLSCTSVTSLFAHNLPNLKKERAWISFGLLWRITHLWLTSLTSSSQSSSSHFLTAAQMETIFSSRLWPWRRPASVPTPSWAWPGGRSIVQEGSRMRVLGWRCRSWWKVTVKSVDVRLTRLSLNTHFWFKCLNFSQSKV